jgi:membrane-bound lytic murein transglycosylase D
VKAGPKGETVAAVAKRHRVPVADVARWNDVGVTGRFKAGEAITLMLPQRKASRGGGSGKPQRKATGKAAKSPAR